jgi:hypothetical protein
VRKEKRRCRTRQHRDDKGEEQPFSEEESRESDEKRFARIVSSLED